MFWRRPIAPAMSSGRETTTAFRASDRDAMDTPSLSSRAWSERAFSEGSRPRITSDDRDDAWAGGRRIHPSGAGARLTTSVRSVRSSAAGRDIKSVDILVSLLVVDNR